MSPSRPTRGPEKGRNGQMTSKYKDTIEDYIDTRNNSRNSAQRVEGMQAQKV